MIQRMLKATSAGMGPQGNCGLPFKFRATARNSMERGKSGTLDASKVG
jgi:hypothetical protein